MPATVLSRLCRTSDIRHEQARDGTVGIWFREGVTKGGIFHVTQGRQRTKRKSDERVDHGDADIVRMRRWGADEEEAVLTGQ